MNDFLAGIYGTGGVEKVASFTDETQPATLSDLALALTMQELGEGADDLEKVASVQNAVRNRLLEFDRAGRAMAHVEYAEFEKEAAEGNWAPLEAFFEEEDGSPPQHSELDVLRHQVAQELQRRLG